MNRARIAAPHAYRPVELKAKPTTGARSRTTSVMTATTEVVISEKSKLEFLISDFSGTAHSRMSTIRMWLIPIPVTVRCASAMTLFDALHMQEPMGAKTDPTFDPPGVLGLRLQESQVVVEHVLDAEKDVAEPRALHQRSEGGAVLGER